jgi:hypothetical protein
MRKTILIAAVILCLAGCTQEGGKDYDAAACQLQGLKPGTTEYDHCVEEEKARKMLAQQRQEFERMKQYDRDSKLRGY